MNCCNACAGQVGFPLLLHGAGEIEGGIQRTFVDLDLQYREVDAEHGDADAGMPRPGDLDCDREASRRKTVDGCARRKRAGLDADDLSVGRLRSRILSLGGQHRCATGRQARFGLGDVGAGDLADDEAVTGLAQLLLKHFDVAPLQFEQRAVAQQIHVDGRAIQQNGLFRHPQGFAGNRRVRIRPAASGWRSAGR